jgi:orotate phosphoribosyltransferase
MLDQRKMMEILRETKALREGHFNLTSGKHSRYFVQISQLLQFPKFLEEFCDELARRFKGEEVDVVVAPAIGGILVGYEVAKSLGTRCLFSEREDGRMVFRRGFGLEDEESVLVVEDIITTGRTVHEVLAAVKEKGGSVRGVGIILDRSDGKVHFGLHTEALISIQGQLWDPEDCPLCKEGIPLCKPSKK